MPARIIDGKIAAGELTAAVGAEVARLGREHGLVPGLAVVLVGEDPASQVYVRNKARETGAQGKPWFQWGYSFDPSASDPRNIQFRVHVKDGKASAMKPGEERHMPAEFRGAARCSRGTFSEKGC